MKVEACAGGHAIRTVATHCIRVAPRSRRPQGMCERGMRADGACFWMGCKRACLLVLEHQCALASCNLAQRELGAGLQRRRRKTKTLSIQE